MAGHRRPSGAWPGPIQTWLLRVEWSWLPRGAGLGLNTTPPGTWSAAVLLTGCSTEHFVGGWTRLKCRGRGSGGPTVLGKATCACRPGLPCAALPARPDPWPPFERNALWSSCSTGLTFRAGATKSDQVSATEGFEFGHFLAHQGPPRGIAGPPPLKQNWIVPVAFPHIWAGHLDCWAHATAGLGRWVGMDLGPLPRTHHSELSTHLLPQEAKQPGGARGALFTLQRKRRHCRVRSRFSTTLLKASPCQHWALALLPLDGLFSEGPTS